MNVRALVSFLAGLKAHNRKPWFDAHRAEYDALRAEFADLVQQVIMRVAGFEPEVGAVSPRECVFRIYRDVRFSKDKSPYKTQFSAAIGPGGRRGGSAGYYFHVDAAGLLLVAGGIYAPDARQLERIRRAIARDPRRLEAILSAPRFGRLFGGLYEEDKLKSAPRGYAAGHPAIERLKLKRYVAWSERPVSALRGKDLAAHVAREFQALEPLVAWLRAALE